MLDLHGGGFVAKSARGRNLCARPECRGIHSSFSPEYLLAAPGFIMGQNGSGCYPEQTNDRTKAILKARSDPQGNGCVFLNGGSAGAAHALFLASQGVAGVDQPDCVACLSPATQLDDPASLLNNQFKADGLHYVGSNTTLLAQHRQHLHFARHLSGLHRCIRSDSYHPGNSRLRSTSSRLRASISKQKLIDGAGHSWDAWPTLLRPNLLHFCTAL